MISRRTKRRLRSRIDRGPWRAFARFATSATIAGEVGALRILDRGLPRPTPIEPTRLTAVIKTFERPREVRRLIRSIRRIVPGINIIVADDSRSPAVLDGVEHLRLPHNSGVSAGRAAGLARVQTPYFVMLDDDFVWTRRTDLNLAMSILDGHPTVDVVGGRVVNLPDFSSADYSSAPIYPTDRQPIVEPGTIIAGVPVRLKVSNFFVGRTATVSSVGWTPELKFAEHMDFFTRACGRMVVVYCDRMTLIHARNPFDRGSAERISNLTTSLAVLQRRYGGSRRV